MRHEQHRPLCRYRVEIGGQSVRGGPGRWFGCVWCERHIPTKGRQPVLHRFPGRRSEECAGHEHHERVPCVVAVRHSYCLTTHVQLHRARDNDELTVTGPDRFALPATEDVLDDEVLFVQ
jgi:hypothetical protein